MCRAFSETTRRASLNRSFVLGRGVRQGRRKSAVDSGVSESYATIGIVSFLIKFMVVCECKRQLAARLYVAILTGAPRPLSLIPWRKNNRFAKSSTPVSAEAGGYKKPSCVRVLLSRWVELTASVVE